MAVSARIGVGSGRTDPAGRANGIELRGLAKSYRSGDTVIPAVRGVDVSIAHRETVAFLGPNGAGKSTTIDMLLGLAEPDALHGWSSNAGPEVFARLPDGRFLAIEEDPRERAEGGHNAVLFGRDPVAGGEPAEFLFAALDGFYPVDAVARADGRVLVLMRRVVWGLPPRFEGAIVLIDPARIEPGRTLHGRLLARLKPPLPMDNFEGMALTRDARGARYLWLISDDNLMGYQRTLLLRLRWDPARPRPQKQRARGSTARP